MNDPDNIRNISIIAHFDNKQPALIKSLIEKTKIILDGSYREIWYCAREERSNITFESEEISMILLQKFQVIFAYLMEF